MSFNILTEAGGALLTESGNNLVLESDVIPAGSCNVGQLLSAASCFACTSPGMFLPLKLALLSSIFTGLGGTVQNVQQLITAGSCFSCLSPGVMKILRLQLLCEIQKALGG